MRQVPTEHGSEEASEPLDSEALYRAHCRFVAGFLVRMGLPYGEVDDMVQEVFLAAHRAGGYRPGPQSASSWLAGIAVGLLSTQRRKLGRRAVLSAHLDVPPSVESPFETIAARESLERVQSALSTLSLEHRAAFVLFELEGESAESIAQTLGVPVGTVYSRLHRARQAFISAYERLSHARSRLSEGRRAAGER